MKPFDSQNAIARSYLQELRSAFADGASRVRDEIVGDIADELRGLDETATRQRIEELGDPRVIAADAVSEASAPTDSAPSRSYPVVTSIVLVAGWYVVPTIGWLAGLIMIGIGDRWSRRVRRNGILASVAVIIVSTIALLVFRGSELWLIGLIIFGAGPLIGNIFVADYLRRRWAISTP